MATVPHYPVFHPERVDTDLHPNESLPSSSTSPHQPPLPLPDPPSFVEESKSNLTLAHERGYQVRDEPEPGCFTQLLTCCRPGGCCRLSPSLVIASPDGAVQRVHLLLSVSSMRVDDDLPPELCSVVPERELRGYLDELPALGRLRKTNFR